jgi:hypothetical protein
MELRNLPFRDELARGAEDPLAVAAGPAERLASLAGDEFDDVAAAVRAARA